MGRSQIADPDRERPPLLQGLPVFDRVARAEGHEAAARQGLPSVALPFELRARSRLRVRLSDGREIAIVLPRGSVLRGGAVIGNGHEWATVQAADEDLVEVEAADMHQLARLAYHLGNRHVPVELAPRSLLLGYDPVLVDMLVGLGARLRRFWGPFEPEVGAYGHGHGH